MKMLEDETEPSIFFKYDFNLSTTSSSVFFDEEISNYLARRATVSLYNISSTPYATRVRDIFNRSKSNADFQTNIDKSITRGNNSDLIQTRVKKYVNEIKQLQVDDTKCKQIEEENFKLEDERKYLQVHGIEQDVEFGDVNVPVDQYKELLEQHKKALSVIESQRIELLNMKSNYNRSSQKENLLEELFRGNLMDNSNINSPIPSAVGFDSTCVTDDICDYDSKDKFDIPDFVARSNYTTVECDPILINSRNESTCVSFHSDGPLIGVGIGRHKHRSKIFSHKYRRHSKILKLFSCCRLFKDKCKVKACDDVPQIFVTSPTLQKSDSGNHSYRSNFESLPVANTKKSQQELLQQLITCADELTLKVEEFKKVAQEYARK